MSIVEKLLCILALIYLGVLPVALLSSADMRSLHVLLPLSGVGIVMNAILLFIVFNDIFSRTFVSSRSRYLWAALIFVFLPVILVYLSVHGFKSR